MILLKNIKEYTPECIDYLYPAIYLETEDGLDWYYHLTKFQNNTLKICFDSAGTIRMFHDDAARLYPLGLSVTEVNKKDVPEGFNIDGDWSWDGEKIVPRQYTAAEHLAMAEAQRNSLMATATSEIAPLQDAVDIGDATDEEIARLKAWKTYRVALSRLDLSTAPDVDWPKIPK